LQRPDVALGTPSGFANQLGDVFFDEVNTLWSTGLTQLFFEGANQPVHILVKRRMTHIKSVADREFFKIVGQLTRFWNF